MKATTTTTTNAFQIISSKDTVTYSVDKKIIDHFIKDQPANDFHLWDILLPVATALITLALTRFFDLLSEKRKYKAEIAKENRKLKVGYLKFLNALKASLGKTHFPDADYDDFKRWTADRMVGSNPFEDLKIHSNIVFNSNSDIIDVIDKLYSNAEKISNQFNWTTKEHPDDNLTLAENIFLDLTTAVMSISKNLNES